ncbi:hypothetical protein EDD16DRAFT_1727842 [Pisolithus croceorrhizus]|nr:hypothetical protein EDD16DRAFT_1727842 [Pisolithus croceorrhizus]
MSQETETVESLIRGPLIGTLVGLVSYGVTFLQAFFYFQTYEDDRMGLKLLGSILETAHAALSVFIMDYYLIAHYGQVQVLQSATWFVRLDLQVSAAMYLVVFLIDFIACLYFTWRIWGFTKKMWIAIFMTTLVRYPSLYHEPYEDANPHEYIWGSRVDIYSVLSATWDLYLKRSNRLLLAGSALFLFGDIFSASMMAYYLEKNRHGLRSTHTLINWILIFVVATGAIIVPMDVVALILILAQSESLAFTSAIFIQTRLYSNSLLASLNARKPRRRALHGRVDRSSIVELPPFSIRFAQQSDIRASAALQESVRSHVSACRASYAKLMMVCFSSVPAATRNLPSHGTQLPKLLLLDRANGRLR